METRTHSFPTARIHIYINKLVHRLFFLFNFRFFLFPFFGERGWGGGADEYQQGSEKCFAVNNSGIQSNFELQSHTYSSAHTHTHTGIQSISKVALSPAYENGTSEISSFILDN